MTKAEKKGKPRVFTNLTASLMPMMARLPKQNENIFEKDNPAQRNNGLMSAEKKTISETWKPQNSQIHFHLIRHWYAATQYHKKPDTYYIANLLGHKHTAITEIYVNMEKMVFGGGTGNDDYLVKIAKTLDEACKLLEVGFEYVTEID